MLYCLAVQFGDAAFGGVMFGVGLDSLRVDLGSFGSFSCGFFDALAAVGGDEGDQCACPGDQCKDELEKI